ncbi:MAG: TerB family tellurite resistance protein [Cyclobacteriaceae bacterium]|nr:TerB family tellurite resistance protein [Cyclobacteriaceae bacterium]
MKPQGKGWLKNYLELRKDLLKDLARTRGSHPEHSLYRVIQPTGLMYGQTVGDVEFPGMENWNEKDKMKILLAESLVSSSLVFNDTPVNSPDELSNVVMKAVENIGNFYNNIFPEMATPATTLFGRRKTPMELAEKILEKRIELTSDLEGNFWAYFFHNSLLFLDIYIFGQWIHTNADRIVADFFRYERDELRFSIVKVIAAAAHANKEVAFEEKRLFDLFLSGTDLPADKRKEAQRIFDKGILVEEMNLPAENSWILKKFFLEIAMLTLWADRKMEDEELAFLRSFCKYLNFSDEDLENSMIAVEGFVLEHWDQLAGLQSKTDFQHVSEQFINRVSTLAEKNRGRILKELESSREVMNLIKKVRSSELSASEKERMRTELIKVLRTIPTFVIVSLPQRFLTLPILLKILPKNLFAEGVS